MFVIFYSLCIIYTVVSLLLFLLSFSLYVFLEHKNKKRREKLFSKSANKSDCPDEPW